MINNMEKLGKIKNIGITAAIFTALLTGNAHASELSSAARNLDTSVNKLVEVKDDLSVEEEVAYRKQVVSDALTLSLKEIESARKKLSNMDFDEEDILYSIKSSFLEWLDTEEDYYKEALRRLDLSEENSETVKNFAKEIRSHRDDSYDNEMAKTLEFIFAMETSRLTETASQRWAKINTDLGKIEKAGLIEKDFFAAMMNEAGKLIDNARSLLNRSIDVIKENYIRETEEDTEDAVDTETPAETLSVLSVDDNAVIEEESLPSPQELCEAAIVNLKSSYGEFVKISASVKKILGLP